MTPNFISGGGKTGGAIYYPFIKDIGIHEMRRRPNTGRCCQFEPFQITSRCANYIFPRVQVGQEFFLVLLTIGQ